MDHLVCFMPGTILLSVTGGKTIQEYTKETPLTEIEQEDLYIASELMATCYKMYTMQPTLLGKCGEWVHYFFII